MCTRIDFVPLALLARTGVHPVRELVLHDPWTHAGYPDVGLLIEQLAPDSLDYSGHSKFGGIVEIEILSPYKKIKCYITTSNFKHFYRHGYLHNLSVIDIHTNLDKEKNGYVERDQLL